jgi:carbon-monoxide dehydrogenase large subunit
MLGEAVRRVEDPRVLRGDARYVDDLDVPDGTVHVAIVRTPVPHAVIGDIDASEAAGMPGVVEVVTAGDLGRGGDAHPHPTWHPPSASLQAAIALDVRPETLRVLARDRVRYAGEPVAAVVASDPYRAADAAAAVMVDYDPMPVVGDVDAALAPEAPVVNPGWDDNVAARFAIRKGDVDDALDRADVVVRETFRHGRQTGTPIEPRGVLALPGDDRFDLQVWSSTQAPHWLRAALATWTGLPAERIRVVAPDVGGGFGIKSMVYPEELLVGLLALRLGRPVKWIESRSEHFLSVVHSRDQRHEIELGVRRDGRIAGLRDRYVVDTGASNVEGLVVPYNTAAHLQGPYRIPALAIDCTCAVTNKPPLSAYRGAGRPEAVYALERALDLAARELGMDPVELRRRNLLRADEMPYDAGIPYRDGNRLVLDAGDVPACVDVAVREIGYDDWRQRQAELRRSGRYIGIGFAAYVEGTGIGPGELARARLQRSGRVELAVALPSQGQGHATTLAQLCAMELGVAVGDIDLVQGDTAVVTRGGGTIASRTIVVVGNAVAMAARGLRDEIVRAAADLLEAAADDLEVRDGAVAIRGAPRRSVTLADIAAAAGQPGRHDGASLSAEATFTPPAVTFASGVHMVVVDVDPWTGKVDVLRYLVAHDCGRVVNPAIVEGQVSGGVVQGIGGSLLEELVYDEWGQLVSGSFVDYLIPRAVELPPIEVHHIETPSLLNPLGIKGVGEAGAIGPPAAIAGAVEDALAGLGARVTQCPLTPARVAALVPADRLPPPV